MHVRLLALLAACFLPVITGCPGIIGDDDDSAGDDDDSAGDDEEICDDGIDNDNDGDIDCDDLECSDFEACLGGCDAATGISCGDMLTDETNADGGSDIDAFACADFDTTGPEVWYEYTAAEDDRITVNMTPTAEDLDLFLVGADADGNCDPDGECLAASQAVGMESITFDVLAGETYWFVVDGFDGATDTYSIDLECEVPVYTWVAVRSRTMTAADITNNTPGPDIDAVELLDANGDTFWADEVFAAPGAFDATAGNANDDEGDVLGESDAFNDDGTCVLDEVADGTSAFYSLGGGDAALGNEGWILVGFGPGVEIGDGSTITVYEVSDADCSNVNTARDDEYEVYIGLSTADPDTVIVDDLEGDDFISLGETITGGGIFSVDYDAL